MRAEYVPSVAECRECEWAARDEECPCYTMMDKLLKEHIEKAMSAMGARDGYKKCRIRARAINNE